MVPSDYEEDEDEGVNSPRPSAISPHCAPTGVYVSSEEDEDEFDEGGTLFGDRRDEGMIGGDKAEAALGDLPRKGTIYSILCLETKKEYVGQTIRKVSRRIREHEWGRRKKKECTLLARAIRKYGWHRFTWKVLESGVAQGDLNERECFHIRDRQSVTPGGYNLLSGGGNGRTYSEEQRVAHSMSMTEWANRSETRKRKKEVWDSPGFREARCKERKVLQNCVENVHARNATWDAKRFVRLQQATPEERKRLIVSARAGAWSAVGKAAKRGAGDRNLGAEFEARWGTQVEWLRWLKDERFESPVLVFPRRAS